MNRVFYTLFFLVLVKAGSSLVCYTCGEDTSCEDRKQWKNVTACGNSVNVLNVTGACLKEVYIPKNATKEVTVRKCIVTEKVNGVPAYDCKKDDKKVILCKVCTKDFCNSSEPIGFRITVLFGALIAIILIK